MRICLVVFLFAGFVEGFKLPRRSATFHSSALKRWSNDETGVTEIVSESDGERKERELQEFLEKTKLQQEFLNEGKVTMPPIAQYALAGWGVVGAIWIASEVLK